MRIGLRRLSAGLAVDEHPAGLFIPSDEPRPRTAKREVGESVAFSAPSQTGWLARALSWWSRRDRQRSLQECSRGDTMAIGPVQLFVLGFDHPDFHGQIIAELDRLKESGTIRVIDALAVYKDADGDVEVAHLSNLTKEEAIEIGSVVGALVGLGIEGEEGMEIGAVLGAEAGAEGLEVFSDEDAWDVIDDIPNDSAAALILIEHHWAVGLRNAVASAGGVRISDGFIDPIDLVAIGLVAEVEAEEYEALSSAL
jgi:uncharacterized membrane protein